MPDRMLKKGFLGSEKLDALQCQPTAESLYVRLIMVADDYGCFYAKPTRVARACWENREDITGKIIAPLMKQLAKVGLIVLYEADGEQYFQITNNQQRLRKDCKPKFPLPNGQQDENIESAEIRRDPPRHAARCSDTRANAAVFEGECEGESVGEGDISIGHSASPSPDGDCDKKPSSDVRTEKMRIDDEVTESFALFWEAYPKRVAKQAAIKAWRRIKPREALFKEIMAGLEKWKQRWTDEQFIPNPASFLNGKRWTDEIPPPGTRPPGGGGRKPEAPKNYDSSPDFAAMMAGRA